MGKSKRIIRWLPLRFLEEMEGASSSAAPVPAATAPLGDRVFAPPRRAVAMVGSSQHNDVLSSELKSGDHPGQGDVGRHHDRLLSNVRLGDHPPPGDDGPPDVHVPSVPGPHRLSNSTSVSTANVNSSANNNSISSVKKSFNADSPSFTPAQPGQLKKTTFSSQAVNATEFTPKTSTTSALMTQDTNSTATFNPAGLDFLPQPQPNYGFNPTVGTNGASADGVNSFNPFSMSGLGSALGTPYNPYGDDQTSLAGPSSYNYQASGGFTTLQPLQYHQYYPVSTARQDLHPYQRQAHEFFMKEELREDLQKKSEDIRLIMPNSNLPNLGVYHSLVTMDTPKPTGSSALGNTVSWVFKAISSNNGNPYCLRRLQGFRLSGADALVTLSKWQRIHNANVVSVVECFTTREFGDSSTVFVHNYHPLSKTLYQYHFSSSNLNYNNHNHRQSRPPIPENVLWNYICQICNALKAIHAEGLAARCIDLTKVIMTDKNRIRLAACGIFDVLEYEQQLLQPQQPRLSIDELQQDDLVQLGKLILSLGANMIPNGANLQIAKDQFARHYSGELRKVVLWLIGPLRKTVDNLARDISGHVLDSLDASLNANDELYSELHKEVENGRVARLAMKLGCVNERPEYEGDVNWSETGERYQLKLFRDYVFHQVDSHGRAVVDLGRMLGCFNKLDAGIDERVWLTSRDHQTVFVVTYKELKKQLANSFNDLLKAGKQSQSTPARGY